MSTQPIGEVDQYVLVSSLYGPGATVGWYLIALACFVSYGLHPRKRRLDSITPDIIAVIAFPTAAAAHLISQIWSYSEEMQRLGNFTAAQWAASVEAALVITEMSLTIELILFLMSVGFKCIRRGCLLATVGSFCFSAECYLYFANPVRSAIERNLDRSFLIDFGSILISIMASLLFCIIVALGLIALFFITSRTPSPVQTADQEAESQLQQQRNFEQSNNARAIVWITMLVLPCSYIASLYPKWSGAFREPLLSGVATQLAQNFIPRSNMSWKDLDQTLAMLAGASVLGFSSYSTLDSYYQAWVPRTALRSAQS